MKTVATLSEHGIPDRVSCPCHGWVGLVETDSKTDSDSIKTDLNLKKTDSDLKKTDDDFGAFLDHKCIKEAEKEYLEITELETEIVIDSFDNKISSEDLSKIHSSSIHALNQDRPHKPNDCDTERERRLCCPFL